MITSYRKSRDHKLANHNVRAEEADGQNGAGASGRSGQCAAAATNRRSEDVCLVATDEQHAATAADRLSDRSDLQQEPTLEPTTTTTAQCQQRFSIG